VLILMIRCIRVFSIKDRNYLALLDRLLRHTFVPRIQYLGFTTRGKKGPLTTTRDLSACKSKRTLIQLLTVTKMILYYRSTTKWSGLGDSTELSRMGLSQLVPEHLYAPE
jgi:hypothetical protein